MPYVTIVERVDRAWEIATRIGDSAAIETLEAAMAAHTACGAAMDSDPDSPAAAATWASAVASVHLAEDRLGCRVQRWRGDESAEWGA